MNDRELDLDALEKVARDSCWPCTPAAGGLFRNTITPATVLQLIALARPKAGGVERDLLQRLHDWFLEAAPEHYAGCGLYFDVNERLAAAPEPLRVTGEEVERARLALAAWDRYDPDISSADILNQANEMGDVIRSVLALIEPAAGKDLGADLSKPQLAESGEGTQPSPTKDADRACDYIRELTNDQVGCGLDPIGFLIASHGAVRDQRDTAQELVRAWEGAVSSLEAHIMDRAAMKDPANPETYLSILRSEIAGVQRHSEQCLASRWHDYKSQRSRIEALEAERDALLAGGVKPLPAAGEGLSDSQSQSVDDAQRSELKSLLPSDAQSVRPDGGEG